VRPALQRPPRSYRKPKRALLRAYQFRRDDVVSTPSFAQMCLVEEKFSEAMLPRVRRFLFCGETLTPQTAAHLLKRFPRVEIWNTYGPTEATVAISSIRIDAGILEQYSPLPVGHPMPGSEIFIVSGTREVLPASQ